MIPEKKPLAWTSILIVVTIILTVSIALLFFLPDQRRHIFVGLLTIASHVLITPIPQEPVLFYCTKFYSTFVVTVIMTLGACFSGVLDYWLLSPILNHTKVRSRFEDSRFFKKLFELFRISPFWVLVVINYSPIPLSPFKLISIAERYPLWKYEAALLVGRTPRYYTLALLGYSFQIPTWVLLVLAIILIFISLLKKTSHGIVTKQERRPPGNVNLTDILPTAHHSLKKP